MSGELLYCPVISPLRLPPFKADFRAALIQRDAIKKMARQQTTVALVKDPFVDKRKPFRISARFKINRIFHRFFRL